MQVYTVAAFLIRLEPESFNENIFSERFFSVLRAAAKFMMKKKKVYTVAAFLIRLEPESFNENIFSERFFSVLRAAAKFMMKKKKGRTVNISYAVGLVGNAGQANYSVAKAGAIGLTKNVTKEYTSRDITANAVWPLDSLHQI